MERRGWRGPAEVPSLPTRRLEAGDFMDAPLGASRTSGSAGCRNPSATLPAFRPPPQTQGNLEHRTPRAEGRGHSQHLRQDRAGEAQAVWRAASTPGLNLSSRPVGCWPRSAWSLTGS